MKYRYIIMMGCLFILNSIICAQTTKVTGVVVDESGEPLPGVNVVIKRESRDRYDHRP